MELVLNRRIEPPRYVAVAVVVERAFLEDVRNLLVHASLARADVADAHEQLVEVVLAERRAVLQHVVIKHEALDDVLFQRRRGPLSEAGGLHRVHSVPDGYDRV